MVMRRQGWIGAVLLVLTAGGWTSGAEPPCCEPSPTSFLQRLGPAGGWHPYGGGLLGWWNPDCFPRSGAPDDYCRKALPLACWPAYPSYYIWGPPEIGHPQGCCGPASKQPH
jgi:hypothetical protein